MDGARKLCALVLTASAVVLLAAGPADARMAAPRIQVLSNRANLVSAGDAYVRVKLPRGVKASRLRLTRRPAQRHERPEADRARRLEGVVEACATGATR